MRVLSLMLCVILCFASCTDRDDDVTEVNIRVKNTSEINFDQVQVGDAEELHLNIAPDDYSEYFQYETAYTYAYVQIISGGETYTLQPIDFVGETPLPPGFYTYELDVLEDGNVDLKFTID